MLENASFVHVFGCMCMLELTITGWWIIVAYLSIPNWFELQLVSQLASYLFSYFLLRSLLPFSNSKFFLISCLIGIHINYRLSINCNTCDIVIYNVRVLSNSQLVVVLIGRLMFRLMSIAHCHLRYVRKKISLRSFFLLDSRPD